MAMSVRLSIASRDFLRLLLACSVVLGIVAVAAGPVHPADPSPFNVDSLFRTTELLEIQIEMDDADWKKLSGQTLDFVSAFGKGAFQRTYTYFPGTITINGRRFGNVEVRKKGFFGSMDQERPSLKIKVDDSRQQQLLGGLSRLTLNNNKQDRTHASQILAYRLFDAAGIPAPRCGLAKVSINGRALGVYAHVETIDEAFLHRAFDSDSGNLYEGVFPTDFLAERLGRFDVKTNKKKTDLAELRAVTSLLETSPADLVEQLSKHLDVDQFITYWALESLIAFWDGYSANQNNYYLYQDPRDKKLRFIPWGADMTLAPPFFPASGNKSVYAKGQLAYRLNQVPAIRDRYQATMMKLLDTIWREQELLAEVDRIEALVRDHLHEAQAGIEQSNEVLRTFIKQRRKEILDEIKNGPVHVTQVPAKPFYMREAGRAAGRFEAAWSPADAKEPAESENASLELVLDDKPVKFQRVSVSSGPSKFPNFGGPQRPDAAPPTVVLSGIRESDQKKLTLTLTFPSDRFPADDNEATRVQGMLTEGDMFVFGGFMRTFVGEVALKSAGREPGKPVAGSISGKLYEMRGFGQ
ncbi:MAG: hypothetical protein RIS70_1928 [Planctomycetota bacterium]